MCEGVALQLDPTFRMTAVLVPYLQRVVGTGGLPGMAP
jgi:hypothetical protein